MRIAAFYVCVCVLYMPGNFVFNLFIHLNIKFILARVKILLVDLHIY